MATIPGVGKTETRSYPGTAEALLSAAQRAIATLPGWKVGRVESDATQGLIDGSVRISGASWGENFQVNVGPASPEGTPVTMNVSLRFGLIDWGKRSKDLHTFFAALDAELPPAGPSPG